MNENELGTRLARSLEAGLDQIEPSVLRRLAVIRETAVGRMRAAETVGSLLVAGAGGRGSMFRPPGFRRRMLWPALALVAGLVGIWYWQLATAPAEGEELEILLDELPLDAYMDKGFDQWLHSFSQR